MYLIWILVFLCHELMLVPQCTGISVAFSWKMQVLTTTESVLPYQNANLSMYYCSNDGNIMCNEDETCCQTFENSYTCCPLPVATCCQGGLQCCPYNTHCDLFNQKCLHKSNLVSTKGVKNPLTKCAESETWCRSRNTNIVCCPYSEATCCSDGIHCCPHGSKCNLGTSSCVKENVVQSLLQSALQVNSSIKFCPDGKITCNKIDTCCQLSDKRGYGCCPYSRATCCADGISCCPHGMKCDTKNERCLKSTSLVKKICPDDRHFCPDDQTCCPLKKKGIYGCCPYAEATCCQDQDFCCPPDSNCDLSFKICYKVNSSIQSQALSLASKTCPDHKSQCPMFNTCCKLHGNKGYGCCKYADAVCCSDGTHCCPHGFKCNLGTSSCVKENVVQSLFQSALQVNSSTKFCPDGKITCNKTDTCCQLSDNRGYGCCPYSRATCCADGISCCPHEMKCDTKHKRCIKATSLAKKFFSDDRHFCPEVQTYCPLRKKGIYGCCPYAEATCCQDQDFCCPPNSNCDLSLKICYKVNSSIQSQALILASKTCPDHKYQCPMFNTCCKFRGNKSYGCCKYADAVCCSDGIHCCPPGNICIVSLGICLDNLTLNKVKASVFKISQPMVKVTQKTQLLININEKTNEVKYLHDGSDNFGDCPQGTTACTDVSNSTNLIGCCPIKGTAVCCANKKQCCTSNFACITSSKYFWQMCARLHVRNVPKIKI